MGTVSGEKASAACIVGVRGQPANKSYVSSVQPDDEKRLRLSATTERGGAASYSDNVKGSGKGKGREWEGGIRYPTARDEACARRWNAPGQSLRLREPRPCARGSLARD